MRLQACNKSRKINQDFRHILAIFSHFHRSNRTDFPLKLHNNLNLDWIAWSERTDWIQWHTRWKCYENVPISFYLEIYCKWVNAASFARDNMGTDPSTTVALYLNSCVPRSSPLLPLPDEVNPYVNPYSYYRFEKFAK